MSLEQSRGGKCMTVLVQRVLQSSQPGKCEDVVPLGWSLAEGRELFDHLRCKPEVFKYSSTFLFLDQIKREKGVWWMPWQ